MAQLIAQRAAYPSSANTGHLRAPGYSSLTAWPGGTGNLTISSGANAQSGTGTPTDPYVFSFYDFNSGSNGGVSVAIANCKFVGCRFQSNLVTNYNIRVDANNITFSYCTVCPLVSLWSAPPNAAWPSAGAGQQIYSVSGAYTTSGGYCIPAIDAYAYGVLINTGYGLVRIDHCDIWGFSNSVVCQDSTFLVTVNACWIHDAGNCNSTVTFTGTIPGSYTGGTLSLNGTNVTIANNANATSIKSAIDAAAIANFTTTVIGSTVRIVRANVGDIAFTGSTGPLLTSLGLSPTGATNAHTDGPGYLNGTTPCSRVSITDNTIATIGNTQAVSFQGATSAYIDILVTGNYLSGFGVLVDMCHNIAGNASLVFKENIFATDLPWELSPVYADFSAQFTSSSNKWRGNKLKVISGTSALSGTTMPWIGSDDGKFVLPNLTYNAIDFTG